MADDKKQKTLFLDEGMAAPPAAGAPLSSQKTMTLDAAAPPAERQMVVPTMMKEPPRQKLPPMARPARPSTWGRWVAGPIVAAVVAAGTYAGAGVLMPRGAGAHRGGAATAQKPQGKLRVNTDPTGASILVDGKRLPRFTPTVVEGDIGATVKLTFLMDGFEQKDAEVYIAEGEHPFNVKLKALAAPTPAPAAPEPAPKKEHHHGAPAAKQPEGKATISVFVRPWAIVFVDHQRLKQTPVTGFELPAGKHVIELANESKNRREKIDVDLKPGEAQEIKRDWDK